MGEVPIEIPLVITFDSCRIVAIMMHSVFKSLINSLLVRNLGTLFDKELSMVTHVNEVAPSRFYYIYNIRG